MVSLQWHRYRLDGKVYVPSRFVAEYLGVTVFWDGELYQVKLITGDRHAPAERVGAEAFNSLVAYVDRGDLWLLDGRGPDAKPKRITDNGFAGLIGWSPDEKWLAYKYSTRENEPAHLRIVGADGSEAI